MTNHDESREEERNAFAIVLGGAIVMGIGSIGLSYLFKTPLGSQISWSVNDLLVGVIATLPLAVGLWWFSRATNPRLVAFRDDQIAFFSEIGFEFTHSRIVLMAVAAGISEELLFRGVLQTWIAGFAPILIAVLTTNIVFGLLHMRTILYAVIAGCVGVYLAAVFLLTENLLAAMLTHGLYDYVALIYTKRAIEEYRLRMR